MIRSVKLAGAAAVLLFSFVEFGSVIAAPPSPEPTATTTTTTTSATAPRLAAIVNGETISLEEVDAILRRRRVATGPLTTEQVKRFRAVVTDDLIDDLVLRQFLRQQGAKVEQAELDQHQQSLTVALQRQGKTLAEFLKQTGQTETQIRETWATLIRFEKFVEARATNEELQKYYAAHHDLFDGSTVRTSHIVLRVSPNAPSGERIAAREKLAKWREQILQGQTTFAGLAKKYSICPSATSGGDLGYLSRRDLVVDPAIISAAFTLKPGEISTPIDTDYGVHLVTAGEKKPGSNPPFSQVSELVRDAYTEAVRRQIISHARKQSKIQITLP